MPPSTHPLRRVQELFEEALQRAPEQRAAFLAEACGDDTALRADVASLLQHQQDAPADFLKAPDVPDRHSEGDARIGRRVGRYLIKEVIAAGGMGTVYLAEQENPRRDVAVKVMHGGLASRAAARRFEYESEILGRLRHPGIAQVYEAGTHIDGDGPHRSTPYFAMEYVPEAHSITNYADAQHLDTRGRLQLFLQVCDAMQYGHQKGVIHRDLKPANILADAGGRVKIIDLGVARTTDSDIAVTTMRTDVGQLIGTVQYMSPEQCEADPAEIDTRSDVYAMGVVLYELICEKLPYRVSRTSIVESIRMVREELPARPSAVRHGLSPNLEAILLKALEKRREARYQSAAELAQDIKNYLAGEPVSARPPTMWGNVARYIVRRPKTATMLVCLLIVAATFVATELAIWWYNHEPFEMVWDKDKAKAQLLTRSGRKLQYWENATYAELVGMPGQLGGGNMAVVGFNLNASHPYRGMLCAYDLAVSHESPTWSARVDKNEVPDSLRELHPIVEDFTVQGGGVFDIFEERPGDEIVVMFVHGGWSQCLLRVYDLSGNVLYQIWEDGGIAQVRWLEDARLLVLRGGDEFLKFNDPRYREKESPYAQVIFALKPRYGFRANRFMTPLGGDEEFGLAWYRVVMPPATDQCSLCECRLDFPTSLCDPKRHVQISVVYKQKNSEVRAGMGFAIDEFCREVPGSRHLQDLYACDQDGMGEHIFPGPDTVRLVPYEEVVASIPALTQ